MSSNFEFLEQNQPELYELGTGAEKLIHRSPKSALRELRTFGEVLVQLVLDHLNTTLYASTQHEKLVALEEKGHLPERIASCLHEIRKRGNDAAHDNAGSRERAQTQLRNAWTAAVWLHRKKSLKGSPPTEFSSPSPSDSDDADIEEKIKAEVEALQRRLESVEGQQKSDQVNQLKSRIEELENAQSTTSVEEVRSSATSTSSVSSSSILLRAGKQLQSSALTTVETFRKWGLQFYYGLRRLLALIFTTIRKVVQFAVLLVAVGAFLLYFPTIYEEGISLLPVESRISMPSPIVVENNHSRVVPPSIRSQVESLAGKGWTRFKSETIELGGDFQNLISSYWGEGTTGDDSTSRR